MASADDYAKWIVDNEGKKGTPEFDTVAKAYQEAKAEVPASTKPPEMFHPSGEKDLSFSNPELLAAHPIMRAVKAAGSTGLGAIQASGELGDALYRKVGIPWQPGKQLSDLISEGDKMTQRGRKELGSEGFDWTSAGGSLMDPGVIKGAGMISKAPGLLKKVGTSAAVGTVIGAAQPVVGDDYAGDKVKQALIGGATGAALPVVGAAAKSIGTGISRASDLVLPGGGSRIWDRYINTIVGKDRAPEVIAALEKSHNVVPNSEPTSAQAVSGVAGGSPVIAAQKITAATPSGISAEFFDRFAKQQAARRKVLNDLSTTGTVEQQLVARALSEKLTTMVQQTPGSKLPEIIGKETPTAFLKALVANDKLVKSATGIPKPIEDVFTKNQMKRLIAVAEDLKTEIATKNPMQQTALQGGVNIGEATNTKLPRMLSTPMTIANNVLRFAGHNVEPKVQAAAARQFLNPQYMAEALKTVPPSEKSKVIQAILAQSQVGASALTGQKEGQ